MQDSCGPDLKVINCPKAMTSTLMECGLVKSGKGILQ